jgi:hypothetical protein
MWEVNTWQTRLGISHGIPKNAFSNCMDLVSWSEKFSTWNCFYIKLTNPRCHISYAQASTVHAQPSWRCIYVHPCRNPTPDNIKGNSEDLFKSMSVMCAPRKYNSNIIHFQCQLQYDAGRFYLILMFSPTRRTRSVVHRNHVAIVNHNEERASLLGFGGWERRRRRLATSTTSDIEAFVYNPRGWDAKGKAKTLSAACHAF